MRTIIYDLGSNNGDDIPYYLKKADFVVAVEANPTLCAHIMERFQSEIEHGKLTVENKVITSSTTTGDVDFFVHRTDHVLSQFPRPLEEDLCNFDCVSVKAITVTELISTYGSPHYVKIDLEGYDSKVLRALFSANIFPPYISAESHTAEVFSLLVAAGKYNAFKLLEGGSVAKEFFNYAIRTKEGLEKYSFPEHSAGPYGEDLPGEWLDADAFLTYLGLSGLGWKDIHATSAHMPEHKHNIRFREIFIRKARDFVRRKFFF